MARFDNMQAGPLDAARPDRERRAMTRTCLTITLVAAAALAGCNKEDHTIVAGGPDGDADANVAVNAPIELPPAIAASKIYRCKDNSVVYIDWLADNKTVNLRSEKSGVPVQLKSEEVGKPMVAEGYSVTGNATSSSVSVTRPGKGSSSCKA
jgi:hypothetical protein